MDRLFQRMQAMYGHRWSSMFPDAMCVNEWTETWSKALSDLTLEQIGMGVAGCLKAHPSFAPTIGEFRECAKPRTEPAHQRLLPSPRPIADVAKHIEAVRENMERPPHQWWMNANALTVQALSRSSDPEAYEILQKIAEHNPTLYSPRRENGWVGK